MATSVGSTDCTGKAVGQSNPRSTSEVTFSSPEVHWVVENGSWVSSISTFGAVAADSTWPDVALCPTSNSSCRPCGDGTGAVPWETTVELPSASNSSSFLKSLCSKPSLSRAISSLEVVERIKTGSNGESIGTPGCANAALIARRLTGDLPALIELNGLTPVEFGRLGGWG